MNPVGSLAKALAAAQVEIQDPGRGRSGQVRGRNNYRYAGLDDLLGTVRPTLAKHGLAVSSRIVISQTGPELVSELLHESGEVLQSTWPLAWPDGPQDRGSELTYARRYTIEALVGVAPTDEDDDGAAAQAAPKGKKPEPKSEPTASSVGPSPTVVAALARDLTWPPDQVVELARDFLSWMGKKGDPWSVPAARQDGLPKFVADNILGVHEWRAWWADIDQRLEQARVTRAQLRDFLAQLDPHRADPARMELTDRNKLLQFLAEGGGLKRLVDFARQAAA